MKEVAEMQELKDIKFYEIKEVAKMLNVTSRTILNYIKGGKLKAVKIGGKWKITEKILMLFVDPQ